MNKESVEEVARRSGISVQTATAMLNAGYAYVETLNEPIRWVRQDKILRKV